MPEEIQEDITSEEEKPAEEAEETEEDITSEEEPEAKPEEKPAEPPVDKFAELEAKIKADYDVKIKTLEERNSNLMSMFNKEQDKNKKMQDEPSYHKKEWVPETYEDLGTAIKTAEERGKEAAIRAIDEREAQREQVKNQVNDFMSKAETDFKKENLEFSDKEFAAFVQSHKLPAKEFDHLSSALSVFKAFKQTESKVITEVEKAKRAEDGVSGGSGKEAGKPLFTGAEIRGKDMHDLVQEALNKLR